VSDWALQQARERVAQLQAEKDAALIIAVAKQIEAEREEKLRRACEMLGYCFVTMGKGMWYVAKNTVKAAAFATSSTIKTAYYAVTDPDELRDNIKNKEIESFVGIACLSGILVATVVQLIDAATH
jgi:hypothetical protein